MNHQVSLGHRLYGLGKIGSIADISIEDFPTHLSH